MDLVQKSYSFQGLFIFAPVLVALTLAYRYLIYPNFLSPLSRVPNAHWSSATAPIWILKTRFKGQELQTLTKLHQKLGPIIRLGPKDLSISQYKGGIQPVYGGVGFDKSQYYNFYNYYGKENAFCSLHKKAHAHYRRRMSNVYSKTALYRSPQLRRVITYNLRHRLLPLLQTQAREGKTVDLLPISYALSLDLVTGFLFGFSSGSRFLLDSNSATTEWLEHYENRYCQESFWVQELPRFTKLLQFCGYDMLPKEFYKSNSGWRNGCWGCVILLNKFARSWVKAKRSILPIFQLFISR
ncbi:hypothetical protein PRK78_006830 [Emydomyces testavorans]|uniref:Cytochrome P450 n=1 Tax=Emydomyces testavorans TaxID=2070801 RepID=A0AAF0DQX1_9EURO|nr:hypothetical protein PRK78_006830 [Emydomyces testavorans]